jgi:hypothetical protein
MGTPYESPWPGGEPAPPAPTPTYTLFDSVSVGIATLLGSPVAGTLVMAVNYRRLGKGSQGAVAVAMGVVVTVLAGLFGNLIPTFFSTAIGIGLILAVRSAAQTLQGPALAQHVSEGGKLGSRWAASGIGVAVLAVIASGVFLVLWGRQGPKVTIGTKDVVYYSGSATQTDAKAVGEKLKNMGYFTDRGVTVFLSKNQSNTVVSFVVKEGAWDKPEMVSAFAEIGREIAPSIGGFPIQVRLMSAAQETKKELTVGKTIIGTKDEVYYMGSATAADAELLGHALKTAGYFQDTGATVLLAKGDIPVISLIVTEGTWDNPATVSALEKIVRQAAPLIGRLPIKFRLLNSALQTKKEMTLQ